MSKEKLQNAELILKSFCAIFEGYPVRLEGLAYECGKIFQNGKPIVTVVVEEDGYQFEHIKHNQQ